LKFYFKPQKTDCSFHLHTGNTAFTRFAALTILLAFGYIKTLHAVSLPVVNQITTFAGAVSGGGTADGLTSLATALTSPLTVWVDTLGNVYYTDGGIYKARKIAVGSGLVTTVAGSGTSGAGATTGQATSAPFNQLLGMFGDSGGDLLYLSDTTNNRVVVMSLSSGNLALIAGE